MNTAFLSASTGAAAPSGGKRRIEAIDPLRPPAVKLRVAAYARVSSDSADQLNSYISQVKYYTTIIRENEQWEFVDIYADEGLSGLSTEKRDDFQRLLADCRKGRIDRILVKSLSRFSRNVTDCVDTIHELKRMGVTVLFEKENLDTAKMSSELTLSLQSLRAQKESLSIAGNMRHGCAMRMRNGKYVPPSAPYGYFLKNRQLKVREDEAAVVRRIFSDYLAGKGLASIADELNREQAPKRTDKAPWSKNTIFYILTNSGYVGDSLWQKTYSTSTLPIRRYINCGEKDQYYIKDDHDPIVSREDFAKVQDLLARRSSAITQKPFHAYLLTKRVICGCCGTVFKRRIIRGNTYWVCRKHNLDSHSCGTPPVSEATIYDAFVRLYNKLRQNRHAILVPMLEKLRSAAERRYRSNNRMSEVNSEIAGLTEQVLVLDRLRSKGYVEPALYFAQVNELSLQIGALRTAKRKIMEQDDNDVIVETEILLDTLEKGPEWISAMDGGLFEDLVENITVESPELVKIRLSNGLVLAESIERTVR